MTINKSFKKNVKKQLFSRKLNRNKTLSKKKYKMKLKKSLKKQYGGADLVYRNQIPVKRIVLYALSANPPTLAHEDIIQQLSRQYDAVFVWASSNPLKMDSSKPEYDPLYKSPETRSVLLNKVLTGIKNVKVDYDPMMPPKYNHANTGISVKKFIDANLTNTSTILQNSIPFKQFNLIFQAADNDIDFIHQCGIIDSDNVELWVCFGLDVVRDTPTWGPNNVFLTCATGIVMINREGEVGNERQGPGLFSIAQNSVDNIVVNPTNGETSGFLKMPFFDWFPYSNDLKRRNIDVDSQKFKLDFKEVESNPHMKTIFSNLEKYGDLKQRHNFDSPEIQEYLLPIEISKIEINKQFSIASSTKVRNLAVQGQLGNKKELGVDQILSTLVNHIIKDDIYRIYGNPTIQEEIAILYKNYKNKKMSEDDIQQKFKEMTSNIQKEILDVMKDNDLNTLMGV